MSDTPRTKAATRMAFTSEYMVEIEETQKMERELADMTKQRDALAEAINDMTQLPSSEAYKRGKQALAVTKGDSHEKYTNNR